MSTGSHESRCAVRGESVSHPGSRTDLLMGKRIKGGTGVVDGVNTDAGIVCSGCLPVYDRAELQYLMDNNAPGRRRVSYIKSRMADSGFVAESLRENAKSEVNRALAGLEDEGEWYERIKNLREFLLRGVKVSQFEKEQNGEMQGLELCRALGCFMEEKRTVKFIQALFAAMEGREGLEIVDAGCGPVPVFGLLAALKSESARVSCLEVNKASAKMARLVVANLGLTDRVKILEEDATVYKHPVPVGLLVSETMYAGLTDELQIQIMRNFESQLAPEGVVIPQQITVEAGLVREGDFPEELERVAIPPDQKVRMLKYVFGPEEVASFTKGKLADVIDISLPVGQLAGDFRLVLSSKVGVNENIELAGGDSVITAPSIVPAKVKIPEGAGFVKASYRPGTRLEKIEPVVE